MSSAIGRISVPTPTNSGLTFPLKPDVGYGTSRSFGTITHRFGSLATLASQTYQTGTGPRKFVFRRANLSYSDRARLTSFWESVQGSFQTFTYAAPGADGTFTNYQVIFDNAPLSLDEVVHATQVGLTFVECPATSPTYAISSTVTRFPSTALDTALASQVQQIIPLVHIVPHQPAWSATATYNVNDWVLFQNASYLSLTASNTNHEPDTNPTNWAVGDFYLSDRLCTVGGITYQPRVLGIGDPNSDVLMTQDISGKNDGVQLVLNNADRVMTRVSNDTDLKYASIDICLYHVNSGILLQLWKGVIQSYVSDGSANFPLSCSDGFFSIMNQYPKRSASRQCYKDFDDGILCPFSAQVAAGKAGLDLVNFPSASATSCDFYLESANGCQAHKMTAFFGGQQCDPQGVNIKDNSTGFLGFGRNNVTATSIVSDSIWGVTLPEIWCNSGGDPTKAFFTNALMVDYRDESDYADSLGIVGAGPIGAFSRPTVATNADGYQYVVAPEVDGFTPQGFTVDGNINITSDSYGIGLRQVVGNDPVNPSTDYFSLGAGNPQVWEPNNYAAGTAFCEIRIQKPSALQPSTPDQHQMIVPLDQGLSGWQWDFTGAQTAVAGLTNPFWICVNMLLRAMGIAGFVPSPLATVNITASLPPAVAYTFLGNSNTGTFETLSAVGNPTELFHVWELLITIAFNGNPFTLPMQNVANQALQILQLNLSNWNSLAAAYQTTANQAIFLANYNTVWNTYNSACDVIFEGNPNRNSATKVLNAVRADQQTNWLAAYYTPISTSPLPGNTVNPTFAPSAQLDAFVLSSLVNADGVSGCADIANQTVPVVLGTGTETQFIFQGSIASAKPFRDWLNEVLNCCLGYFSWQFGKLKLGCRINAAAQDAFTLGNMLYQSLTLAPIQAAFEHLVISYADMNYAYQANTAEYSDKDHAAYYGRSGAPLTAQMHSVGISTLSQALRIALTRVREECGGVGQAEWLAARNATFKTTLLALGTEVGEVISITHPDIPNGVGNFRIKNWKLMKDYSIQIQAQTVTDSMYQLDVGPPAIDVVPAPLPIMFYDQPQGVWAPYQIQANSSDALFPNEYNFDISGTPITLADGTLQATLAITGKLPANEFIPSTGAVNITGGNITQSASGGSLLGGRTYRVIVCATNANGVCTPPSQVVLVTTPLGSDSNQFNINNITWPAVSGLTGYVVFASNSDDLICEQQTGTGTPSSITVTGPFVRSSFAAPDPDIAFVRLKAKTLIHGGVLGAVVDSATGNTIVSSATVDVAGTDNWAGRVLSIIGRNNASSPVANFNITAFDPATGTFTLDRSTQITGHPEQSVQAEDTFVVCFLGYDNSSNPYLFTDAGMQNALDRPTPHMGPATNSEVGEIMRVIAGTNRGQRAKVVANTGTSYTLDAPLVLDYTSIVILEAANWTAQVDSSAINNANPQLATQLILPVSNFLNTPMLLGGFTVSEDGTECPDGDIPLRMFYLYGLGGTRTITSSQTILRTDGRLFCDSTGGSAFTVTLLPQAQLVNQIFLFEKISMDSHQIQIVCASGDTYSDGTTSFTLTNRGDNLYIKF